MSVKCFRIVYLVAASEHVQGGGDFQGAALHEPPPLEKSPPWFLNFELCQIYEGIFVHRGEIPTDFHPVFPPVFQGGRPLVFPGGTSAQLAATASTLSHIL